MPPPTDELPPVPPAASRADFRAALAVALAFVAALVVIHVLGAALGLDLQRFGVHPREWSGLAGIIAAPMLHGNFAHLVSNALPLAVVGTVMLYLYPDASRIVLPAVYLGPGLAVWLFGRDSIHIGASGLVYGVVGYVFVAGVLRRDRRAIAASMLVAFMYGALVWGVLPIKAGVSWETHLAAALIGVALAFLLRHRDPAMQRRYAWEDEPEVQDEAFGGDGTQPVADPAAAAAGDDPEARGER
ncbi:MAG: rhomboid family intramembrane serine protease [Burkholderiales bacterium]|nr:rhomboid family intramembrane serine protease [Burkholderiales bacterium]